MTNCSIASAGRLLLNPSMVSAFPAHIHIEGRVEAAEPPDLSDVLRKIDELLYPDGPQDNMLNN